MKPGSIALFSACVLAGCLEHSPYDASVCRSGVFARPTFQDGGDETTFFAFADQGDDVSQCGRIDALVVEGFGNATALDDLVNVTDVGRLAVGPTTNLTTLNGLASLASIDSDLTFVDNEALANITGLASLTEIGGGLVIEDNPLLSLCDVEVAIDRLNFVPDTVSISGVDPCDLPPTTATDLGTGYVNDLILFEGMFQILDVSAADGSAMLVSGLSTPNVSVLDDARLELANTSTTSLAVNGLAALTSPSGTLSWSLFFGGDWPLSFRDEVLLRFAQFENAPQTAVYAGWVTNVAHIGNVTIERSDQGEALWVGTIDANGVASEPVQIEGLNIPDVTSVVAVQAQRRNRVWILVKSSDDIFSTHTLVLTDLDDPSRSTSVVVSRGPVELSAMAANGDGVIVSGRRSGTGAVVVGSDDTVPLDGDFGFVVRVEGSFGTPPLLLNASQALASFPDGAGSSGAPNCFANLSGGAVYSIGTDLAGNVPVGRVQAYNAADLDAVPMTFDMYGVAERPPLGLPFDPQLACGLSTDGRVVASGIDTFARGGPARTVGWRLSAMDFGVLRAQVQELTVGRIQGIVDRLRSTVAPDGTAFLYGPLPSSLQLTPTIIEGRGQLEVFVATRQVFAPVP